MKQVKEGLAKARSRGNSHDNPSTNVGRLTRAELRLENQVESAREKARDVLFRTRAEIYQAIFSGAACEELLV